MIKCLYIIFALAAYGCRISYAEPNKSRLNKVEKLPIPIVVSFAAGKKIDIGLGREVYLFNVHCVIDTQSCSLERITLNNCHTNELDSLSFTPEIDTWASWAGSLQAKLRQEALELTIFQRSSHAAIAKMVLGLDLSNSKSIQVKSVTATGFLDDNEVGHEGPIEYVPLIGNQTKQLDCPVFLPGISQPRFD